MTVRLIDGYSYPLEVILGEVEFYNGSCSHWASPAKRKKDHYRYNSYACYAPFSGLSEGERASLYIGVLNPRPLDAKDDHPPEYKTIRGMLDIEEGYQRWMEWITTRSPHWAAVDQEQELGGEYNRFVKMNVGATTFLVHHTACVLRIHQEHEAVPLYWMLYTHTGMEEDLAYLMALMTTIRAKNVRPSMLVSHAALSSSQVKCLAGFLLRQYDRHTTTWEESSKYAGHGSMWDDGRGYGAVFTTSSLFPNERTTNKKHNPFEPAPGGHYPFTKEGVAEFVEVATTEVPRALCVQLIDKPETNGVKYEKS